MTSLYIYDGHGPKVENEFKAFYPNCNIEKVDMKTNYKDKNMIITIHHSSQSANFFTPQAFYYKFLNDDNFNDAKKLFIVYPSNDSIKYWKDHENYLYGLGEDIIRLVNEGAFTCTVWKSFIDDVQKRFGTIIDKHKTSLNNNETTPLRKESDSSHSISASKESNSPHSNKFGFYCLCTSFVVAATYLFKGGAFIVILITLFLLSPPLFLLTLLFKVQMLFTNWLKLDYLMLIQNNFITLIFGVFGTHNIKPVSSV